MKGLVILIAVFLSLQLNAQGLNQVIYGQDGNVKYSRIGLNNNNYTITKYHPNGQKAEKGHYKDGLKHGTWKSWDQNGKLTAKAHYKNGEKTGTWIVKDFDGHCTFEISFSHNHMLSAIKKNEKGEILATR